MEMTCFVIYTCIRNAKNETEDVSASLALLVMPASTEIHLWADVAVRMQRHMALLLSIARGELLPDSQRGDKHEMEQLDHSHKTRYYKILLRLLAKSLVHFHS